ncbi:N-acetylmuramic acid 6-phosphate etherase [Carnobacterium sp. PL24RED07]|uniref:N-acetylmuramic acid 6-phosphate etherase n=1 Tax=Lactobacillales TaxID=186826 RepID=UPI00066179AC|nr:MULTISPECIES: N-acetylmuramic acid 6-phosphate etherase [Lactobacillales]KAF3298762.1 N-acetylmuramic acid 6-phosphate etherase [Carnobacterium sp. PL26RED25]KAF3299306.1 N-acetylmuramic acid 6-phosphate etherase [Carnobacterium sp. PL12RED10]KAF3303942.1 N-acetylmuramic acid 6-phosphate etherase [Carnobacterium sp. PL24RED07]MDT2762473.1 N-acetylmuramic acid 6-phosphate etherase [Aerococcus urinaeequi]HCT98293.1 N-acetylmuramic acid 6-phosphate etherase [Aerococcus urinaeequi]
MSVEINQLTTEKRNPNTMHLDQMSVGQVLELMNKEDQQVPEAIAEALGQIEAAVETIIQSLKAGGRLIYFGAGTSGRLGVLDAAECVPTFGVSPDLVVGLIAGGDKAMVEAVEGAEDSLTLAEEDFKKLNLNANDTVVGIAASGRTPYVIGGLQYAQSIGAKTVSIACNQQAKISRFAQIPIEVDCGPEVLTGSTRLKAGTAQKLILNMLSTVSMIGIGKVYQNLMVDVQATNEKLEERSKRIIMAATECSYEEAASYFEAANHKVKVAIVMILTNLDATEASQKINAANGFVNQVLQ